MSEVRSQRTCGSEKRFQESAYFIVVADGVEVEQYRGFQREHQSQSPPNSAFVNTEPAPLGREVANASAGMQMWITEVLLNPLDQPAHAGAIRLGPTAKFGSQIFVEIGAIKLLRSSLGTRCRVRCGSLLWLWHADSERSFSSRGH